MAKEMLGYPTKILFNNKDTNYQIVQFNMNNKQVVLKGNFTSSITPKDIEDKIMFKVIANPDKNNENTFFVQEDSKGINPYDIKGKSAKWYIAFLKRVGLPSQTVQDILGEGVDVPELMSFKDKTQLGEYLKRFKGIGNSNRLTNAQKILSATDTDRELTNLELMVTNIGYKFTDSQMLILIKNYPNNHEIIEQITHNFYDLIKIKGFGINLVDKMYMSNPNSKLSDEVRIKSIVMTRLNMMFDEHSTWATPNELLRMVTDFANKDVVVDNQLIQDTTNAFKTGCSNLLKNGKIVILKDTDNNVRIISKKVFDFERNLNGVIKTISEDEATPHAFNDEIVQEEIKKAEEAQGFLFTEEQVNVIQSVLSSNIVTINGYAGTGKSSIVRAINAIFRRHQLLVTQVAFTGRAADSLSKSSGQQASTAHAALNFGYDKLIEQNFDEFANLTGFFTDDIDTISPNKPKEGSNYPHIHTVQGDVIICDEYPTLSIKLLSALLYSAMTKHQKVILIGDSGQLPAIDFSSDHAVNNSPYIKHFNLSAIKRQSNSSKVITHSLEVREGKVPKDVESCTSRTATFNDINYDFVFNMNQASTEALSIFKMLLNQGEKLEDIIILSPLNNINNQLNLTIQNTLVEKKENGFKLPKKKMTVYEGEMLINTRNQDVEIVRGSSAHSTLTNGQNSQNQNRIFNGNVGKVLSIEEDKMKVDFGPLGIAIFKAGSKSADALDLAYAITTHKAQGSTIKNVIAIFLETQNGGEQTRALFSKQMLYTMMTRPSDKLFVITNKESIADGVSRNVSQKARSDFDIIQDVSKIEQISGN